MSETDFSFTMTTFAFVALSFVLFGGAIAVVLLMFKRENDRRWHDYRQRSRRQVAQLRADLTTMQGTVRTLSMVKDPTGSLTNHINPRKNMEDRYENIFQNTAVINDRPA